MTFRRYATPAGFKAALEQRLRSRAAGDGLELQRLRQLVVFERFVARVFVEFSDAAVLKGGLALELRLERARTTKDIVLRLMGPPDDVLDRLQAAGRVGLGDPFAFIVLPDPRHPTIEGEGLVYEGLRFRAEGRLADKVYGRPFGVDVAFAEPLGAAPDVVVGESWLSFAGVEPSRVRIYPLETHIAEKLHAFTLPRKRTNSRVKDLPDIALLGTARPIDAAVLRAAIDRTWTHRGTHALPLALPDPPVAWERPYQEMARANRLPWATLAEVIAVARGFVDPVLTNQPGRWDPASWRWEGR